VELFSNIIGSGFVMKKEMRYVYLGNVNGTELEMTVFE
jgi:hypothetical protein